MEKQRKAREVDVELILLISWVLVGSMLIGVANLFEAEA